MKGTVRRRGAGWKYYYRELDPGTGKWRQRSKAGFSTRQEATVGLREQLHAMDRGSYVTPSRVTLRQYLEETWLPAIRTTIRPSTDARYVRKVRLRIVPKLGALRCRSSTR